MLTTFTRRARLIAAGAALAAAGTLASCSAHPGQGAVAHYQTLDGSTVTVNVSMNDVDAIASDFTKVGREGALQMLIVASMLDDIAREHDVTVTDEQVDEALAEIAPQDADLNPAVRTAMRATLINQQIQQAQGANGEKMRRQYEAMLSNVEVTLSPRFAQAYPWIAGRGAVAPATDGGL